MSLHLLQIGEKAVQTLRGMGYVNVVRLCKLDPSFESAPVSTFDTYDNIAFNLNLLVF